MNDTPRVRGGAPSDAALLALFVDLVDEYDRLSSAFPVSVHSSELLESIPGEAERWHRIVRTLSVRKFILGAQDAVRVDRVLDAYRRCIEADGPGLEKMERAFIELAEGLGRNVEIFEDVLYGDLLHGEHDRRERNRGRTQLDADLAVWVVGEAGEFLIRNVRNSIVLAARDGRLSDEATEAVHRLATGRAPHV